MSEVVLKVRVRGSTTKLTCYNYRSRQEGLIRGSQEKMDKIKTEIIQLQASAQAAGGGQGQPTA